MTKLEKALMETFGVELEEDDKIEIRHCYADHMIFDIIVNDEYEFYAYNARYGCFPY